MLNDLESQYATFLKSKRSKRSYQGKNISLNDIHSKLFDFQKYVTKWAVHKGTSALFLDTGLGKTFCQLEWCRLIGEPALIIAPLSVARQTLREAKKIDLEIKYIRHREEIDHNFQIHITNYEMIESVHDPYFKAIVLDESSILKSLDGKIKTKITKMFKDAEYKLACTATPSPNDIIELGNHTEFLGICKYQEMLAEYFIHANKVSEKVLPNGEIYREKQSNKKGTEWRLKNYGKKDFYAWLTGWAMSLKKPSDLGFDDNGFILPSLNIINHFLPVDWKPEGKLFFDTLKGIQERGKIRHDTIMPKIEKALEIINGSQEQWVIWCGLNDESSQITKLIPGAIEVKGSDDPEYKAKMIEDFQDGKYQFLITKAKIAGYGLNLQNSHNMIFIGLSDSWESYYQCVRRQWRFGQDKEVNVHIILTDIEREIYNNVQRKEQIAKNLHNELMNNVKNYEISELLDKPVYIEYKRIDNIILPKWLKVSKDENNLSMRDMQKNSDEDSNPREPKNSTQILQSEVQWNSENFKQKGTDSKYRILLSELRGGCEDISKSIEQSQLHTKILQSKMFGRSSRGNEQSGMEWRPTLPEWIYSNVDARSPLC